MTVVVAMVMAMLQRESFADEATRDLDFSGTVTPFLKTHCVRCHGENESEGDVTLHGHGEGEDPIGNRRRIRKLHCDQIARLAGKLAATPEGQGSMLDNTLIVYFSDAGEKHHASSSECPFVLVGGLNGWLKTTGRYLQFPGYQKSGHHTIANLYNTLAHAVGLQQDRFGQLDSNLDEASLTGPLSQLLV